MLKKPRVSVVVVNYNGQKYLETCIKSVLNIRSYKIELIIVDNASTDGSIEFINNVMKDDPRVSLIQNKKNYGPAYARNRGSEVAKGEYIAFLDNDTRVHENWLIESIKYFENDKEIGACQCKLILEDSIDIIDCVGEYLGQTGFLVQLAVTGEERDHGQYNDIIEIFAAKSAGMIVRKNVLLKVGGFDEDFFMYMEESDLCWRIWLQNYKVVLMPNSIVYHKSGTSSVILPEHINYFVKFHGTKNYISTLLKNLEVTNLFKILSLHLSGWIAIILFFLSKKQLSSVKYITHGLLWNLKYIRNIIKKRRVIQNQRKITDNILLPKIMKKKNILYFARKLTDTRKIGNANGWDK